MAIECAGLRQDLAAARAASTSFELRLKECRSAVSGLAARQRQEACECPTFLMLSRDAQLDASFDAGWKRASEHHASLRLEDALAECTDRLMSLRRPEGPPGGAP